MTLDAGSSPRGAEVRCPRLLRAVLSAILLGCALSLVSTLAAQAQAPVAAATAPKATPEQGVRWSELKPAQQASLRPLEAGWSGIDLRSKKKWVEFSSRFPKLTPEEQARVQTRMAEWAKLTPKERGEARMHFQEAKQVPAQDRQERWKAYQALTPEQRQQLAARAAPAPAAIDAAARKPGAATHAIDKPAREPVSQAKSNIVTNPAFAATPRWVAPTVVQARPGATTTLITKRASPPGHQQTGLPKIAATPEFVDKATLLPQRGPQGAATRSAAAPEPAPKPQQ